MALMGAVWPLLLGCGTKSLNSSQSPVRINEVASTNNTYEDRAGDADDWIELYNTSDTEFDLGGYYVSDDVDSRFAKDGGTVSLALESGVILPANGVLVLWADKQPGQSTRAAPHLSFALSAQGEGVWLSNPSGYVVDYVEFGMAPTVAPGSASPSFARFPDGTGSFKWCSVPTPEARNGTQCRGEWL
jgi:hypothetical protein